MIFPVKHPFYDVLLEKSEKIKYSDYRKNIEKFVTQYYFYENPAEILTSRLEDAGFEVLKTELQDLSFMFKDLEHIQGKTKIFCRTFHSMRFKTFQQCFDR